MDSYHSRPLAAILGAALLASISVAVLSGALLLAIHLWPEASSGGRAALCVLIGVSLSFSGVIGLYTAADVAETRGRVYYHRERRLLLLEQLEERLSLDLDGDGVIGAAPSLPQVLPVHGAAVRYDAAPVVEAHLLEQVDELLQDAERLGSISRSALERAHGREFYDWLLSTSPAAPGLLVSLGLITGRGRRSSGRLAVSAEEASARVREAFGAAAAASVNAGDNGRN